MKTLIMIDVQNDFMPGGALAIKDGDAIIPVINRLQPHFDLLIATQDWHAKTHTSFASNHAKKQPFDTTLIAGKEQVLWPDHCIQGSFGAEFASTLNISPIETIFRKAMDIEVDSYSCFYDNHRQRSTGLRGYLHEKGSKDLYFCGLAADFCVYFSILDALEEGFDCWLIEDATRPFNPDQFLLIKRQLVDLGVHMITSDDILQTSVASD